MENKNYFWRPVSEYTGGRVLATNGLDVLIGEINSDGDCESEENGCTVLCGITGFIKIEEMLPELEENEGERIRKELIDYFSASHATDTFRGIPWDRVVTWFEKQGDKDEEILILKDQIESLHAAIKAIKETHRIELEKQGEHAKFIDSIQVGDKVTRNQDGVLVNLSQLKRVAKPALDIEIPFGAKDSELQEASYHIPEGFHAEIEGNKVVIKKGEQNLVKIPKFKIGDTIKFKGLGHNRYTIKDVCGTSHYINTSNARMDMSYTDANFELVEQKPADKVEPKFKKE